MPDSYVSQQTRGSHPAIESKNLNFNANLSIDQYNPKVSKYPIKLEVLDSKSDIVDLLFPARQRGIYGKKKIYLFISPLSFLRASKSASAPHVVKPGNPSSMEPSQRCNISDKRGGGS